MESDHKYKLENERLNCKYVPCISVSEISLFYFAVIARVEAFGVIFPTARFAE